jgi:hypothetical protein
MTRAILCVAALAAAGCGSILGFDDVRQCEGAECPGGGGGDPDAGDAPVCETADDCETDAPVCDTEAGSCRTCESHDECAAIDPAAPGCAGDGTCVECVLDEHCASEVCDTGSNQCVAEADVVYMAPDGSTDAACGTHDEPCKRFIDAFAQVAAPRDIVKVNPGTYNADALPIMVPADLTVTLLSLGATIDPAADGAIFQIGAGATFTMRGGEVSGATGGTGAHGFLCSDATSTLRLFGVTVADNTGTGIRCIGTAVLQDVEVSNNDVDGVDCDDGVSLTMTGGKVDGNTTGIEAADDTTITQVDVFGNSEIALRCHVTCDVTRSMFRSNAFGGVDANATAGRFVNNLFLENGGGEAGSLGAIFLWPTEGEQTVLFAYNTVVGNHSRSAQAGGVHCVSDVGVTSPNNLVQENLDTDDKEDNFSGTALANICHFTYSNIGEIGSNPDNNIDFDPSFIDDYHLPPDASCKDHGNVTGVEDIVVDIDGETRPFGDAPDCGCDEFVVR